MSNKKYINRKDWNRKRLAPPYQRINRFSKKSLQDHIEGSKADHIERGLQNQYQRWGYNPEMLYGRPFHKKNIEMSSAISMFEVVDFSIFWFWTLFCHEIGSSSSKFNINRCSMKQFSHRFRCLRSPCWAYSMNVDLNRKYRLYKTFDVQQIVFLMKSRSPRMESG